MKKLIALLLAVLMCVSLCACGKDSTSGETQPNASQGSQSSNETTAPTTESSGAATEESTEPTSAPGIALSDDPEDLTVSIDGVVYQLPCTAQTFIDNGWLPESDWVLEDDFEIPGGESRGFDMYKNGENKEIGLRVYNPGKSAGTFGECIVYEVYNEVDTDVEFILSGDFALTDDVTAQDVFDLFGSDYTHNEFNGDWYKYTFAGKGYYTFTIKEDVLCYFSLELAGAMYEN